MWRPGVPAGWGPSRSDQPGQALREASRVLRVDGCLLILDRVLPVARRLTDSSGQTGLIENQLRAMLQEQGLTVVRHAWFPGRSLNRALFTAIAGQRHRRTGTDD